MSIDIFFWINLVLSIILIVTGSILLARNKNTLGGKLCILLGVFVIITRTIQIFI